MAIITLTKDNFKEQVYQNDIPVLVQFHSIGCSVSRMMQTVLEEIAQKNESIKVGKVDIEKEDALSYLFDIKQTPTLILFKNCEIVKKEEDLISKDALLKMVDEALAH